MTSQLYFDFGRTIAIPTVPVERMLVEVLAKAGKLDTVGGTARIEQLTRGYQEVYRNKSDVVQSGLNEHGRPFLFEALTAQCDDPQRIIEIIQRGEIGYFRFSEPGVKVVLEALQERVTMGLITDASYTHNVVGFIEAQELQHFFSRVFSSSGLQVWGGRRYSYEERWKSKGLSGAGVAKEDGSLYRHLISKGFVAPGATMVGDKVHEDGIAARDAGLNPLVYVGGRPEEAGRIAERARSNDLQVIERLEELIGIIQ